MFKSTCIYSENILVFLPDFLILDLKRNGVSNSKVQKFGRVSNIYGHNSSQQKIQFIWMDENETVSLSKLAKRYIFLGGKEQENTLLRSKSDPSVYFTVYHTFFFWPKRFKHKKGLLIYVSQIMYLQLCSTTTMLSLPKNIFKCFVSCECPTYCPPASLCIWKLFISFKCSGFSHSTYNKKALFAPKLWALFEPPPQGHVANFFPPRSLLFTALLGVEGYYNRIKVIMAKNMVMVVCFKQNTPVGWVKSHTSQPMTLKRSCYMVEQNNIRWWGKEKPRLASKIQSTSALSLFIYYHNIKIITAFSVR